MFHLVSTLYTNLTKTEEVKVLMVGCDGAGKTTLQERIKQAYAGSADGKAPLANQPLQRASIVPTVGLNIARIDAHGRHVLLWDLGGHASLRQLWGNYYPQCQGVVFVIDASDRERFPEARMLLHSVFTNSALVRTPVLILANKSDVRGAATPTEIADAMRLADLSLHPRFYAPTAVPAALCGDSSADAAPGADTESAGGASPPPGKPSAANVMAPTAAAAAAAAGDPAKLEAMVLVSPLQDFEIPADVAGTSGIGGRAFHIAAVSAHDASIVPAFKWIVTFLATNARPVVTL